MSHVLLIDNYDSFTFNLYQYLGELADEITVVRNDAVPIDQIHAGQFTHIVISPGPGDPTDPDYFHDCRQVISEFYETFPILGICLGHQGIGAAFGAKIVRATKVMHGKTSQITHESGGILHDLPKELTVMRYHSLVVDPETLALPLLVDATTEDGTIMAVHHKTAPLFGVQFHPESFATPEGKQLLKNFLAY